MNKRQIGALQEERAICYLEERGVTVAIHNYRIRQGEIDIIGYHEGYLVFIEVKYRKDNRLGNPAEAVDYKKQRIICRVADYYRYTHGIGDNTAIRYDVIAICGEEIIWYQNAFTHIYR